MNEFNFQLIYSFSATFSLTDIMSERVKEIAFNDERPEQFVLTTDSHVLFLTWVSKRHTYTINIPSLSSNCSNC